jgi:starch synthase
MIVITASHLELQKDRFDSIESKGLIEAISGLGNEVVVFTIPREEDIKDLKELIPVLSVDIDDDLVEEAQVLEGLSEDGVKKYYISSSIIRTADNHDDVARVFSLSVIEAIKKLNLQPRIIHTQGWHSSLIASSMSHANSPDTYTVFGINGIPKEEIGVEGMESLRSAIELADTVVIGSKTYLENLTKASDDDVLAQQLKSRKLKTVSIPFPLSDDLEPDSDKELLSNFSKATIKERPKNINYFIEKYSLVKSLKTIIVGLVGDISDKDGDVLVDSIEGFAYNNIRVIGSVKVSQESKKQIEELSEQFPGLVGVDTVGEFSTMRQVAAAADVVIFHKNGAQSTLLPLLVMKYGSLPVAPNTDIYKDIIEDYNPNKESGNGFLYDGSTKYNILASVIRAAEVKKFPYDWSSLVDSASDMALFWRDVAKEYVDVYRDLLGLTDDADKQAEEAAQIPVIDK